MVSKKKGREHTRMEQHRGRTVEYLYALFIRRFWGSIRENNSDHSHDGDETSEKIYRARTGNLTAMRKNVSVTDSVTDKTSIE